MNTDKYYKILELEPGASLEQIRQAYRDMARVWHPDRFSHDLRLQEKAQEKMKEINEAYEQLQNQLKSIYINKAKKYQEPNDESESTSYEQKHTQPTESPFSKNTSLKHKNYWIISFIIIVLIFVLRQFDQSPQKSNPIKVETDFINPDPPLRTSVNLDSSLIGYEPLTISNQEIIFKNGKRFKTNIYELKFIGLLQTKSKAPYMILSGRVCDSCGATFTIWIHSVSDGKMKDSTYPYPGTLRYRYEEPQPLLYEARVFYGNVLPNVKNGIIWYQNSLQEDSTFKEGVYLIEVINDELKAGFVSGKLPDISLTEHLLQRGLCKEIKGLELTTD